MWPGKRLKLGQQLLVVFAILTGLSFIFAPAPGQPKAKKFDFEAQAALSYIRDLAAEAMLGRRSGHQGGEKAEEYIAARFKEWGIEPAGENGTYFQNFTVDLNLVEEGVHFELITPLSRRSFFYGEDWRVQGFSGSAQGAAEIVFVGYGLREEKAKYDDYAGLDVKGKWVLLASNPPSSWVEKFGPAASLDRRIRAAQELGAKGVFVFRREEAPASSPARGVRFGLGREIYRPDFAIIFIENRIVDAIFRDLLTDLRYLFQEIENQSRPMSFATGTKAFLSVHARFEEKRPTRNVLGKISGSDPQLKDESSSSGEIIPAINQAGLLLLLNHPSENQIKEILTISIKPIGIIGSDIPSQETLELIRTKGAGFALVAARDTEPAIYVQKLLEVRKLIGSSHLFIVNGPCLWGKDGQDLMFQIIAELLKAGIESGELGNLLSGNFLRLLSLARGEATSSAAQR